MKHLPDTEKSAKPSAGRQPAATSIMNGNFSGKSLSPPVQKKPNETGLPDQLKDGVESLSGHSMDDVNVHYNSSKPAQLNAHAYAQGSDIHLGPGQEKHLPHEAWHVVQQKIGRVKPTLHMKNVAINNDPALEKEADQMGSKVAQMFNKNDFFPSAISTKTGLKTYQLSAEPVVQRKVNLDTTLDNSNLKNLKVSTGGALGVVLIPAVVAKYEVDPQAAVDTADSINTMLGGASDQGWSVGAPRTRRASPAEANAISQKLAAMDQNKPGSAGDSTRVGNMIVQIQNNLNNIVIQEQAAGKDFVKHLAKGPESNDDKKAQKQKFSNKLKKGRGLDQLAKPAYARQLGRIAAIDIFMGNRDRLHGAGNFENWMSDAKSKTITLIDNEVNAMPLANWSADQNVNDLAQKNFANLAATITNEVEMLLFHGGYGGGKLSAEEQSIWTNSIRHPFEANMAQGLSDGRFHIMNKGWSLAAKLHGSQSPLGAIFEERLNHFHLFG